MRPDAPTPVHPDAPDLLHGGLLFRMMSRFGVDPERAGRAARRAAATGLVLWLPMAALTLVAGTALPGRTPIPFLLDVAAYVRPLVVIPLLIVAEPILGTAWRTAGHRFRERGLVGPAVQGAYDAQVERVTRAVRRSGPELLCLALAGLLAWKLLRVVQAEPRDAWFAQTSADGSRLTPAGVWALGVHFVLIALTLRWLWLLFLWYRFLWGVSRLPLRLFPTHPDRAAGLAFLGLPISASGPLTFAWSAALASAFANLMLRHEAKLADFLPIGLVALFLVLVVFVLPPLLIFAPLLIRTRQQALEEWGRTMAQVGERLRRGRSDEAAGADAASASADEGAEAPGLEDVQIAVASVRGMLPLPFLVSHLVGPIVGLIAPALVLVFLAVPAAEVFQKVVDLVF
jgi:hypothetical protein